jgi:hypothetical protein
MPAVLLELAREGLWWCSMYGPGFTLDMSSLRDCGPEVKPGSAAVLGMPDGGASGQGGF